MDVWTVIRFLHVVALALFVGGQIMLVVAVVPAIRRLGDETAMRAVARRFGIAAAAALGVLIATGIAMTSRFELWDDSVLQVKLIVLVLIGALIGLHVVSPTSRALSVAVFVASLLVVWLGVQLAH